MDRLLNNLVELNDVIRANLPPTLGLPERPGMTAATVARVARPQARSLMAAVKPDPTSALEEENVSGQRRYRIEMTKTDNGNWQLTLHFNTLNYPQSGGHNVVPHVALFSYPGGQQLMLPFDQILVESNGLKAILNITTLQQRDQVYSALSDSAYSTYLVSHFQDMGEQKMHNLLVNPETFYFPLLFYRYIYQDIIPEPIDQPLLQLPLEYNNTWYNYYQDHLNRSLVYYLPELFVVGMAPKTGLPYMSLLFSSIDGSDDIASMQATLSYFLVPVVDKERINHAKQTVESQQDIDNVVLAPLLNPQSKTLSIELPAPAGLTEEKNALIDIQGGIHDKFTLSIPDFTKIWDALFSASPASVLFRGQLKVTVKGFSANTLTVTPRLSGDKTKVMKAIIDPSQPAIYEKTLTIMTVESTFDERGDKTIELILVDVGGQTVPISKTNLKQSVKIKLPIIDVILGSSQQTEYTFDQKIIYKYSPPKSVKGLKTSMEIIYVPASA